MIHLNQKIKDKDYPTLEATVLDPYIDKYINSDINLYRVLLIHNNRYKVYSIIPEEVLESREGFFRYLPQQDPGYYHAYIGRENFTYKRREREFWLNMIEVCYNKHDRLYPFFGGQGIKVCERWLCYEYFVNDVTKHMQYPRYMYKDKSKYVIDFIPDKVKGIPANKIEFDLSNTHIVKFYSSTYKKALDLMQINTNHNVNDNNLYTPINVEKPTPLQTYVEAEYQVAINNGLGYTPNIPLENYVNFSIPLSFNATPVDRTPILPVYGFPEKKYFKYKDMVKVKKNKPGN